MTRIRAVVLGAAIGLSMAWGSAAFAQEGPTVINNAVGNLGNTAGTSAVGNRGNTNQNMNQNFIAPSQSTSVGATSLKSNTTVNSSVSGSGSAVLDMSHTIVNGGGGTNTQAKPDTAAGGKSATESVPGDYGTQGQDNSTMSPKQGQSIDFGTNNSQVYNINLLQLPGVPGVPGNFSQPYKPDQFLNGAGPIRPKAMTMQQADQCRGGWGYKDTFVGRSLGAPAQNIALVYPAWNDVKVIEDISSYVGISSVLAADKPWLPSLCEAAFHAMQHGVTYGIVEFIVRPKNTMKGFGFGSAAGGSGFPSTITSATPYALAGTLGFGVGWSSQRVEGGVMIQIHGLAQLPVAAVAPPAASAAPAQKEIAPQAVPKAQTPPAVNPVASTDGKVLEVPTNGHSDAKLQNGQRWCGGVPCPPTSGGTPSAPAPLTAPTPAAPQTPVTPPTPATPPATQQPGKPTSAVPEPSPTAESATPVSPLTKSAEPVPPAAAVETQDVTQQVQSPAPSVEATKEAEAAPTSSSAQHIETTAPLTGATKQAEAAPTTSPSAQHVDTTVPSAEATKEAAATAEIAKEVEAVPTTAPGTQDNETASSASPIVKEAEAPPFKAVQQADVNQARVEVLGTTKSISLTDAGTAKPVASAVGNEANPVAAGLIVIPSQASTLPALGAADGIFK